MKDQKTLEWVLRIAVAGEFIGHGAFALQGKEQWVGWVTQLTGITAEPATQIIMLVGLVDVLLGLLLLWKPVRPLILWMAVWGLFTALVRPLVDMPIWDFVERWANWGAPLALYLMLKDRNK